jgi:8-oxo-dGTP pyrophosphatase MutT (NUDIX family)
MSYEKGDTLPRTKDVKVHRNGVVYADVSYKIETANGVINRDVITKNPVAVIMVYHRNKNKYVLCEEFRVGPMANELGFPAGVIDDKELPMAAAVREVREETGHEPELIEYLGQAYSSSGFTNELAHFFYAIVSGDPENQKLDHDENIKLVYLDEIQLKDRFCSSSIGSQAHTCYLKYMLKSQVGPRSQWGYR